MALRLAFFIYCCCDLKPGGTFPIDFNDFINSSGHFGIDLVSCEGRFGVIFGIWGGFGALSEPIRRRKA